MKTASWLGADHAGSFFGQHAILVLGLVLASVFGAAIGLWHLLDQQETRLWNFADAAWKRLQNSAVLSYFRDRFPRAWTMVTHRLSPEGYLGLHFTISLCVLSITAASFFALADEVGEQDWLVHFDRALSVSLHEHSTLRTVGVFRLVTNLGNASTLAAIGMLVVIALVVSRHWQLLCVWAIALGGVGLINEFLKNTFQRVRPQLPNPWITESGWSFPSGHAMGSLVIYGMLAYSLGLMTTSRALRLCIVFVAISLVIAIGFSRIYLGVHYFSDVVAGYCAATFWLVLCITGNEVARRHRKLRSLARDRNSETV
jgi:membrane-associated phospholipid phosphatase